jgi:subtilisin family serine protease
LGEGDAQTNPTGLTRVFALNNGSLGINEAPDGTVEADIAVLDTGIDSSHPDLDVVESTSCVPANEKEEKVEAEKEEKEEKVEEKEEAITCAKGGSTDPHGHGTHVAGTAAAIDNTFGVVGVAPGARLWSVRVLNAQNRTTASRVTAGVDWVTAHAAEIEVANLSLSCTPSGGKCSWPTVETAINTSVEKGVVYVVSAGNLALKAENISPAKNPNAITAGAIADYDGLEGGKSKSPPCSLTSYEAKWGAEKDDSWANLSNWGPAVDVAAPGVCIYSTLPGNSYGYKTGTSMATPEVSGAAAIIAESSNPANKADVVAVRERIEEVGNLNWTAEHEGPQQPLLDVTELP